MSSIASSGIRLRPARQDRAAGVPAVDWAEVRATLKVLLIPAVPLVPILVLGIRVPAPLLYLMAAVIAVMVVARSFRTPEPLLALTLLYMPLSRTYPATVLPAVNGTNVMLLLLLFFWWYHARLREDPWWRRVPGVGLVLVWAAASCLSGVTVMATVGPAYLFQDVALEFKAWVEQFIFFFAFVNLIRDGDMARRVVIYLLVGGTLSLLLGVSEMFAKSAIQDFEDGRVAGPHMQPNDFGAFLVYAATIVVAILAVKPFDWRRWAMLPWLGVVAKVLVATASRGAWLAMASAAGLITWLRGLRYAVLAVAAVTVLVTAFPQLIPDAIRERIEQTRLEAGMNTRADASSTHRLVLWQAGLEMTLENPIFGLGFKGFPHFKSEYVSEEVREADPHNMFLYVSSQMGIPAMLVFVAWLGTLFVYGYTLWRKGTDDFLRAIGLGGAALALAAVAVNFFGSRMVGASTALYLWVYFAVLGHLFLETQMPRRHLARHRPAGSGGPRAESREQLRRERVRRHRERRRGGMLADRSAPRGDVRRPAGRRRR